MAERWTPDSWRGKPVLQMPQYPDAGALADVEAQLATFPPLVFAGEARNLKKSLARLMAHAFDADFQAISAVFSGVKEIREAVARAELPVRAARALRLAADVLAAAATVQERLNVLVAPTVAASADDAAAHLARLVRPGFVAAAGTARLADVLRYVRWVMVRKRDEAAAVKEEQVPSLPGAVAAAELRVPAGFKASGYDRAAAGSRHGWDDYAPGERIDHVDGMTVEDAEQQIATRLYQNTAKVHFNNFAQKSDRFGKRLIYGGHVISLARALSFNGLANAFHISAINGGRHVAPLFAGDTLYAWSEVLAKEDLGGAGALRLRLAAVKNKNAAGFPFKNDVGEYDPAMVLDFDYWAAIPKR